MTTQIEKAERFLALHQGPEPLLLPNPWDIGSAKLLASLGFSALASTSGGFAATLGRPDGHVTRGEALTHASNLVEATNLPVSADLENCFADDPETVAETVALAIEAGLTGCSLEDFTRDEDKPIYDLPLAAARVAAAAEAAATGPVIALNPQNNLRFGPICSGRTVSLNLAVFNVGSTDLIVNSVQRQFGSPTFRVAPNPTTPVRIGPNSHIDFTVQFSPTSLGHRRATIAIASNDPGAPTAVLTAAGRSLGGCP